MIVATSMRDKHFPIILFSDRKQKVYFLMKISIKNHGNYLAIIIKQLPDKIKQLFSYSSNRNDIYSTESLKNRFFPVNHSINRERTFLGNFVCIAYHWKNTCFIADNIGVDFSVNRHDFRGMNNVFITQRL